MHVIFAPAAPWLHRSSFKYARYYQSSLFATTTLEQKSRMHNQKVNALAYRERRRFTHAEYLTLEERADAKSEFYQGEIHAVSGGQDMKKIEVHSQQRPGQWLSTQFTEGEFELVSLGTRLTLDDIYRDVHFQE